MHRLAFVITAAAVSGCSSFPTMQTPFSVRNPLVHGVMTTESGASTTYMSEKAQAFVDAYKTAKTSPNDSTAIRKYLGAGITYSHLLCKDYFDRLTLTKAHRDFAKKETNLAAGLSATVLGLAKASSANIAGVGALFSFGGASFDAYNESFIVSPELSELERLVKEKQLEEEVVVYKKLNAQANQLWPDRIETLDQAERALSGYIFHCTVNGMRILLSASIQQKTKEIEANVPAIQSDQKTAPTALPQK